MAWAKNTRVRNPPKMAASQSHALSQWVATAMLICLVAVGLYLFALGFFPMKTTLPGYASLADSPPRLDETVQGYVLKRRFGRLVLMVVDALSSSLFFGSNAKLDYTKQLIEQKKAYAFTSFAQAPTVTLPRIKVSI